MADESIAKSYYSVLILAFVCSLLVAGTVVGLRPLQEANRLQDQRKNILYAAGLYSSEQSVEELFAPIETRVIELATGLYVAKEDIDPATFNQLHAAQSDDEGKALAKGDDIAGLNRLERYSLVYLVQKKGKTSQIILPIRGKGLWSTMYAYVAIEPDLSTIRGISFYEHGETPGLGGQIDNRAWQDSWRGKRLYDSQGDMKLRLQKGKAASSGDLAPYEIDGLSGATLTANGVTKLLEFWFGDHGFKPYLTQLQKEISNG
jgi:Na+-transporting NADH:ubiquinone oxidoreductase subunit C